MENRKGCELQKGGKSRDNRWLMVLYSCLGSEQLVEGLLEGCHQAFLGGVLRRRVIIGLSSMPLSTVVNES